MPLPPLAGSLSYGTQVGLRSTLDASRGAKQPYYVSLGNLPGAPRPSPLMFQSPSFLSEASTVPGTPFPSLGMTRQASPFSLDTPASTSSPSSTDLLPICCTASHPYRPLSSTEFCFLRASAPLSGDAVQADEEVLLVAGFPRSVALDQGKASRNSSPVPEESHAGFTSQAGASLWLLCCPRRTEVRQFAQRVESSRPGRSSLASVSADAPSSSSPLLNACALFGAPDEEDVGVVCARGVSAEGSLKSLFARVERRCRWKLIRAVSHASRSAAASAPSRAPPEDEDDAVARNADDRRAASAEAQMGSSVLHLDEEVLLQNCHTGQFLSLRMSEPAGGAQGSACLVAVGKPVFASSLFEEKSETGRHSDPAFSTFPFAGPRFSQLSSASRRASATKRMNPLLAAHPSTSCMHSGWRIVPAGVRVAPCWDRVFPHTLVGPSEIDDALLKRESFLGVRLTNFISGASANPSFPGDPPLSLSPYADEPTAGTTLQGQDAEDSGSHAFPFPQLRAGAAVNQPSSSLLGGVAPRDSSARPSLAESWRSAGPESLGENDWVMRRLHADWPALPREVKERFLLEDLLFCLSGLDGTLIRILAVSSSALADEQNARARGETKPVGAAPKQPHAASCAADPVLPEFHYWFHPLLSLAASSSGSSEGRAAAPACSSSLVAATPGAPDRGFSAASRASEGKGEEGHSAFPFASQAASEDAAFCQMLPPLLPAACSLRLLLVFLELAGRRNSAKRSPAATAALCWGGEVAEAFCGAIKKVVEELGIRVGVWEGEVRRGRLTLQGLRAQLGPVSRALGVAEAVVREAWGRRGGAILDAVDEVKARLPCNDANQEICRFIFEKAVAPLARIVENWVLHGVLKDTYGEFFIREDPTIVAEGEPSSEWRGASLSSSWACVRPREANDALAPRAPDAGPYAVDWCRRRFLLLEGLVPNFLKAHAKEIHRAGLYVYVLNSCSYAGLPPLSFSQEKPSKTGALSALSPRLLLPLIPAACARASTHVMHFFFRSLELPRTLELLHAFFLVGRADFLQRFFEFAAPAEGSNLDSGGALGAASWSATLQEIAGLEGCMELAIRSVNGFDTLKEKISFFMHPMPSLCEAAQLLAHANEEENLRRLLGLPARALGGTEGAAGTKTGSDAGAFRRPSPTEWCRRVCLRYRCDWPLSLLYTPRALCSYELVFRFLLHLHLAQRQLNQLWMHIHETRGLFSFADMPTHLRQTIAIGEEMRVFTRNVLFYATTDVVALHYSTLLRHLQSLSPPELTSSSQASPYSLADVQELHACFLSSLLRDLFLEDLALLQAASKCLTICLVFSRHVRKFSFEPPEFPLLAAAGGLGVSASVLCALGRSDGGAARDASASHDGRDRSSDAEEARSAQKATNARERMRDARRRQVRAAVDSAGYGGMVRSAGASFRENFNEFLSKLEAFSRRFPSSPCAHLLTRLHFNDCLASRGRQPVPAAASTLGAQAAATPSGPSRELRADARPPASGAGGFSMAGEAERNGVATQLPPAPRGLRAAANGDRDASASVSLRRARGAEDERERATPPLLPPARGSSSFSRGEKRSDEERDIDGARREAVDGSQAGGALRQPATPRDASSFSAAAAATGGLRSPRRIGAFELPPAIPVSGALRQAPRAAVRDGAGDRKPGASVSASAPPFELPSTAFTTFGARERNERRLDRRSLERDRDLSPQARGASGLGPAARGSDEEFLSEEEEVDARPRLHVDSDDEKEDAEEDFDAALRSFQARLRGDDAAVRSSRRVRAEESGGDLPRGGARGLTRLSPRGGARNASEEADRRSEADSIASDEGDVDFRESDDEEEFSDGPEDEPRRGGSEPDDDFFEDFEEEGSDALSGDEGDERHPLSVRPNGDAKHEEGYAAAFLRSRADLR
ncbi:Spc97 / Spc98 family protein [Besnoitia besnoiti]|uniref:Spc97 / Spc98 family protein n=1 Tax=Besnoitia besnoiti TaxID=94643 RepID=A0A2A9MPG7_BESBE|nr:Spc97 / Spc98 family protein [Besnoitia besnoiti]PFH37720.1 Spc97 / Spc98 family protein [Besnoitia besnoiti]